MITKVEIQWNAKSAIKSYTFDKRLNILTGKNGSRKTTLLKALWYTISNNFVQLFKEVDFKTLKIYKENGEYYLLDFFWEERDLNLKIDNQLVLNSQNYTEKKLKIEVGDIKTAIGLDFFIDEVHKVEEYIKIVKDFYNQSEGSLFFPTFRRIEGGFDVDYDNRKYLNNSLKDNLEEISKYLSKENHSFITSVSTDDIETLVSKKYAEINYEKNFEAEYNYQKVIKLLNEHKEGKKNKENDLKEFEDIFSRILKKNKAKLYPFEALNKSVRRILKNKHIKIGKISLGELDEPHILSKDLSAGEKQVLGFLCYNFFYDNTVFFIDEPELSLHVDWQRTLFNTLLSQRNNNQFIISTHSPFIYSRFPSNEILMNQDRGE